MIPIIIFTFVSVASLLSSSTVNASFASDGSNLEIEIAKGQFINVQQFDTILKFIIKLVAIAFTSWTDLYCNCENEYKIPACFPKSLTEDKSNESQPPKLCEPHC
ncbi:uncharacterized protein LOC142328134 [Lycorma delicatula]|uniref:uncharacterized protein LOC142328134 n=1 Tax=Lycorma delicatula TaxID=130591 RepID=UPI003F518004